MASTGTSLSSVRGWPVPRLLKLCQSPQVTSLDWPSHSSTSFSVKQAQPLSLAGRPTVGRAAQALESGRGRAGVMVLSLGADAPAAPAGRPHHGASGSPPAERSSCPRSALQSASAVRHVGWPSLARFPAAFGCHSPSRTSCTLRTGTAPSSSSRTHPEKKGLVSVVFSLPLMQTYLLMNSCGGSRRNRCLPSGMCVTKAS